MNLCHYAIYYYTHTFSSSSEEATKVSSLFSFSFDASSLGGGSSGEGASVFFLLAASSVGLG